MISSRLLRGNLTLRPAGREGTDLFYWRAASGISSSPRITSGRSVHPDHAEAPSSVDSLATGQAHRPPAVRRS